MIFCLSIVASSQMAGATYYALSGKWWQAALYAATCLAWTFCVQLNADTAATRAHTQGLQDARRLRAEAGLDS